MVQTGINFFTTCGLNPVTGYGKLEQGLLRGFDSVGVQVTPAGPLADGALDVMPARLKKKLSKSNKLHSVTVVTALPYRCEDQWIAKRGPVFLYTMSESTRVSQEWVDAINRTCTGVFLTCPALVQVYRKSGVRVPLYNVGCGVDYHVPKLGAAPRRKPGEFIFLAYSYSDMRKGAHKAIMAFKQAFGDRPEFKLWIKSRPVENSWLRGCQDEQIRVIETDQSEAEWFNLLRRVNAFLFPSYGEGYGLPPREAVLAGTPAIATKFLGMWDVACWGLPIRVKRLLPAQFDVFEANAENSLWADPDQDSLAAQMQWVVRFEEQARAAALRGREYLLKNCTWAQTAQKMIEVINGVN